MPRRSRIEAPGALHHVIARGIDRSRLFFNDADREDFLERLGEILEQGKASCDAWALDPNHVHLLLKTGTVPISLLMKRLLTGYAATFNLKHGTVHGKRLIEAPRLLCYWAAAELGMKQGALAGLLHPTRPAISFAGKRGEEPAKKKKYGVEAWCFDWLVLQRILHP